MIPQQHELPVLGAIASFIRWIEELVSLISGPLLTVGLGIALIDLLTDGGLLRSMPALLYAWAVSMAVGVDAQLVAAWDRVRMALRRQHWWTAFGYVVLGLALGYVGVLSAEAFGLQHAFGLSEADALARLGIDVANWQFQRAVLSVFLVALSGFTRYHAPPKARATREAERDELERQLELEPLRQQLRATQAIGAGSLARQAFGAVMGRTIALARPPTGPGAPAQSTRKGLRNPVQPAKQPGPAIRLVNPPDPGRKRGPGASVEPQAWEAWSAASLSTNPAILPRMSVPELQERAGISRPAAMKYHAKFSERDIAAREEAI